MPSMVKKLVSPTLIEIHVDSLQRAASVAREITAAGGNGSVRAWQRSTPASLYTHENPLHSADCDSKRQHLERLDAMARDMDPRVKQVIVSMAASHRTVMVSDINGHIAADIRPLVSPQYKCPGRTEWQA